MRSLFALLALVTLGAPTRVLACAVCAAGESDDMRVAFILTTIFLTVLPLLFIGGGVYWFAKRAAAVEAENERQLAELRAREG